MTESDTGRDNLEKEGLHGTTGVDRPEISIDQTVSGKRPQSAIRRRRVLRKAIKRDRG
ncbi:MAG TPA: hypothetical protein VLG67_04130 [Candidatus Saccharimonadales bacterium]|nr:hypothetical protein [Candidatus Saccharimonadales bacterium]